MSTSQKQQTKSLTLDERLERLDNAKLTYGDQAYDIITDFMLKKHLNDMNSQFAAKHICFSRGGAGPGWGDTSIVGIGIPMDKSASWILKVIRPIKTAVIEIKLREWGASLVYAAPYKEYAEKIKQDYDQILEPRMCLEMSLVEKPLKDARRQQ
ncbi:MAG: hypothetical protein ABSD68_01905 [Candidatus Micrarchaeales archaeon]|jgi:hypothetical protein